MLPHYWASCIENIDSFVDLNKEYFDYSYFTFTNIYFPITTNIAYLTNLLTKLN